MKKLILLSDLWGAQKSEWIEYYTSPLKEHFDIVYYDCCALGELDISDYSEEKLHQQFVQGGIDRAITNLLLLEKEASHIIGFSVGGYIAWKAILAGLPAKQLIAISSTRLRHETFKPTCDVQLIYGENDTFQPKETWYETMKLGRKIIPNAEHDFYRNKIETNKIIPLILEF